MAQATWEKYPLKPVIDIGCGFNRSFDFDYVAFDRADIMGPGLNSVANHWGDFHDMSEFADNTFGFINAEQVIEHSTDPAQALKEWTRILKVGGIMYLVWPSWCPKHTPEEIAQFHRWDKMLADGDKASYLRDGGNTNWISIEHGTGKMFIDVHFSNKTMDEMKEMLPWNLEVVEEYTSGDSCLILRKTKC